MRIVLDTNLLCSALMVPKGTADQVYMAWRDRRFSLVTSEDQLEEFRRVTRYPKVRQYIEPAAVSTRGKSVRNTDRRRSSLCIVPETIARPGGQLLARYGPGGGGGLFGDRR